jgi:integrase
MTPELELLLESCKSEHTKKHYVFAIQKYFDFLDNGKGKGKNKGNFKLPKDRKEIEDKIIEYIIFLKKKGMSYCGITNYIVPVKSFYTINDITLNVKKLAKFMPENRRMRADRPYSHEQISKILEIADERMRSVILLLASSGIRVGALPFIRFRHLQDTKLTVYEGFGEEYSTFITPECKQAIDSYLDMRSRYGEKLNDDSFLIREQFDIRCPAKPKQFKREALQYKIYDLCNRAGIDKKDVAVAHGFRRFFMTQLVNSKVNPEIREMLLGHKIGLAGCYYKPTEEEMFAEYEKATDLLTINEENRLRKKVETLEIEKSKIDTIALKLHLLEKKFNNNIEKKAFRK